MSDIHQITVCPQQHTDQPRLQTNTSYGQILLMPVRGFLVFLPVSTLMEDADVAWDGFPLSHATLPRLNLSYPNVCRHLLATSNGLRTSGLR